MRRLIIILILQCYALSVQRVVHKRVELIFSRNISGVNPYCHIIGSFQHQLLAPVSENIGLQKRICLCRVYCYCFSIIENPVDIACLQIIFIYSRSGVVGAVKHFFIKVAVPENSEIRATRTLHVCAYIVFVIEAVSLLIAVCVKRFTISVSNARSRNLKVTASTDVRHHTSACITASTCVVKLLAVGGVY